MNILFVGSGMQSLIYAEYISRKFNNIKIDIVEKDKSVGGLYGSINDPEYGKFDHGMHLYYETGINHLDDIISSFKKYLELNAYYHNRRDIAGRIQCGYINEFTPFMTTKFLNNNESNNYIENDLVGSNFDNKDLQLSPTQNVVECIENRYGSYLSDKLLRPYLVKLFGENLNNISSYNLKFTTSISRIIFESQKRDVNSRLVERYPKIFGIKNQFELPIDKKNNPDLAAFYPKYIGFSALCDAIYSNLNLKSNFFFNSFVNELKIDKNGKFKVKINSDGNYSDNIYDFVIWTAPSSGLAKLLDIDSSYELGLSKKSYIHVVLSKPHSINEAYYLYDYDDNELKTFRISLYNNYSEDINGLYKLTIESWGGSSFSTETIKKYLIKNKIIDNHTDIYISSQSKFDQSFPLITNDYIIFLQKMNNLIRGKLSDRLIVNNAFFDHDEFFLHELLRSLDRKLNKLL
jgi:protoporphyrinogen oxidase